MNKFIIFATIACTAHSAADHTGIPHHHPHGAHEQVRGSFGRPIGSPQFEQLRAGRQSNLPTIAEAAVGTPSLSTLVAALKAADLVGPFAAAGKFTVFAPNNDAFAKIPSDALANLLKPENKHALRKVLRRHVVAGWVIKAGDIPAGSTNIISFGSEPITVTNANGGVSIQSSAGRANVIATDVIASNGVVHVVDSVF